MQTDFIVGQTYNNRLGVYEVLAIEGDTMTIRYDDGTEAEVSAAVQARIISNIGIDAVVEEQLAHAASPRRPASKGNSGKGTRSRGRSFKPLLESDFKGNVTGTRWRSRTHLGGAVAYALAAATGRDMQSFAVYRQPAVHLAEVGRYQKGKRHVPVAKLVVELDASRARYGFYVEKSQDEMDDTWDWQRLLAVLSGDAELTGSLLGIMNKYDLAWCSIGDGEADEPATFVDDGSGSLSRLLDEETVDAGWPGLVAYLEGLPYDQWRGLYLCADMPKAEVLAMGDRFVRQVVDTFAALMPLYDACTRVRSDDE